MSGAAFLRCPLTSLAPQAWALFWVWAERSQGRFWQEERRGNPEILGFEGEPEEQLGTCGRDPWGRTPTKDCGGADVEPTEPGEESALQTLWGSSWMVSLPKSPPTKPETCPHLQAGLGTGNGRHMAVCGSLPHAGSKAGTQIQEQRASRVPSLGHWLHGWQATRGWTLDLTCHGHPHALTRPLKSS